MHQKGYKLYNLITKTVFVSRDVVFHERFFPFQQIHSNQFDKLLSQFFLPIDNTEPLPYEFPILYDILPHPSQPSDPPVQDFSISDSLSSQQNSDPTLPPSFTSSFLPRKSHRISKTPSYLQDYVCPPKLQTHNCNLVSYTAL